MSSCWITRGGWFQKHRSPMTHIFVGGIPTRCGPPPEGRCGSHWGAYTTCCYGVDGVGGQWPVVDATLLLSWLALPHTRQSPHHAVTYDNDSFLRGRKVHLPPTYLALNQCKGSLSAFFFSQDLKETKEELCWPVVSSEGTTLAHLAAQDRIYNPANHINMSCPQRFFIGILKPLATWELSS